MLPTAEKPSKICIRGLPANTELRAIQKDLIQRGFDPIFIRYVKPRDVKSPGIFYVHLQKTPKYSEVYDVKKILDLPVRVEEWRGRQGPPQCHRCQGFRHSAADCLREHRCVHCARPHPSKNCNRPYDIPTCANCGGAHAADDLSCPSIRREQLAKAGKVLRTTGYTLPTPIQVDESSAPSSLMAEANNSWSQSKRKNYRKNKWMKKTSVSPDRLSFHSEESETLEVKKTVVKKGKTDASQERQLTKPAIRNHETEGNETMTKKAVLQENQRCSPPQSVSQIIEQALIKSVEENKSRAVSQEPQLGPAGSETKKFSSTEIQETTDSTMAILKNQNISKPIVKEQSKPTKSLNNIDNVQNTQRGLTGTLAEKSLIPVQELQQTSDLITKIQINRTSTELIVAEQSKLNESLTNKDTVRAERHTPRDIVQKLQETEPQTKSVSRIPVQEVQQTPDAIIKKESHQNRTDTAVNADSVRSKAVYDCLLVLRNVLTTIQEGHNPVPIILEGLADLQQGV